MRSEIFSNRKQSYWLQLKCLVFTEPSQNVNSAIELQVLLNPASDPFIPAEGPGQFLVHVIAYIEFTGFVTFSKSSGSRQGSDMAQQRGLFETRQT